MFEGVVNMPLLQNKAGARCAERTLDAATWNVNLRDVCFEIFQWYELAFDCATYRSKIYELVLFNNIFVQLI